MTARKEAKLKVVLDSCRKSAITMQTELCLEVLSIRALYLGRYITNAHRGKAPRTPRSRAVRIAITNGHRRLSTIVPGNGARRNRSPLYIFNTAIVSGGLRERFLSVIF